MQEIEKAADLLAQKEQLFTRYDDATAALLTQDDAEDIEKYITEREALANKIDEIDKQIVAVLAPWGDKTTELLGGRANADTIDAELLPLLECCNRIMTLVRRIRMRNTEATSRMEGLMSDSERRIRRASNMPKINRYVSGLLGTNGGNNLGSV